MGTTRATNPAWKDLSRAVIVPGHAIYVGGEASHARLSAHWLGTFPGYRGDDEARCYAEHAEAGAVNAADAGTLLVFSGGQTREIAGPRSEGQSYWLLADQCSWFRRPFVRHVAVVEEFARDSFENLLFGIRRFRQCVGHDPKEVVVCGFAFKRDRYLFHAETICDRPQLGCSGFRFSYVSVNDPPDYLLEGPAGSRSGERATLAAFHLCPLGDEGELLEKRLARDPFRRGTLSATSAEGKRTT